jgi:hypothetical protein
MGLGLRTFKGASGKTYLVFETLKGGHHVFAEVEAKEAARDCGTTIKNGTSREMWKDVWESWQMVRKPRPSAAVPKSTKPSLFEQLRAKKAPIKS